MSDQGAGTYEAWTLPATGGAVQRAVTVPDHAVRSLCWSASGELLAAADRGGTELHQLYVRHPDGPVAPVSVDPAGKVKRTVTRTVAGLRAASSSSSVAGETFGTSAAREKRLAVPVPPALAAVSAGTPVPNAPARPVTVLVSRPVALIAPAGPVIRT